MEQRGFLTEKAIVWLVAIAASLALWGAAVHAYHLAKDRYDGARREEGRVEIRGLWKSAVDADTKRLDDERQAKDKQQKEADRAAAETLTRLAADNSRLRGAGERVRQQLAATTAAWRAAAAREPAAAGGPGEPGADPLDLLANLFSRADREAAELAEYADALRTAGQRCERYADTEVTP